MNIVYENDEILVVNKPSGKLTQGDKSFDVDLASEVMTYRRKKGEEPYGAVINRLDRPVSGLVLFAKNKKKAAQLSKLLAGETFNKQYYAVACGRPASKKGVFTDYLLKDGKLNQSKVVPKGTDGSKEAKLEYEVVGEVQIDDMVLTMLRIHLITGRHHQIRVQFASRGLPLAGDVKYGEDTVKDIMENGRITVGGKKLAGRNEIALCAYSLTAEGKTYTVEAPFAEIFNEEQG